MPAWTRTCSTSLTRPCPNAILPITVTPASDWWLRVGRTWLLGNIKADLVWSRRSKASDRSTAATGRHGSYRGTAWSFSVGGAWLNTTERPGFEESDARAQRWEQAGNGAVEIRALAKTFFGIGGEQRRIDYDDSAIYQGSNHAKELNRTVTSYSLRVRNQLTPLTSVNVSVGRKRSLRVFAGARFRLDTLRLRRELRSVCLDQGLRADRVSRLQAAVARHSRLHGRHGPGESVVCRARVDAVGVHGQSRRAVFVFHRSALSTSRRL